MNFERVATSRGFSLLELLIVVVLAAIIMSLGIPSYREYSMRANRADATSALLRIGTAQERFFLAEDSYTTDLAEVGFGGGTTDREFYNLDIQPAAGGIAAGYTVTATAAAGQGQDQDTECVELSIDESGRRGSNPGDPDICWR